ncbi:hypothetical protein AaE_006214 [Aphanomyces astaci]|uniref:Cyclic nucleotide-binding domain-containing protein n=1 Tax=Aphanomyces astaci TaxID=112090 RepID=A0A6A5ADX4_APHAT|nr:hypothetical protein AaE_006214 [Aphanomyces astaci]
MDWAEPGRRQSISAPAPGASLQQNARLVARSWNFRAKQRHKYSTTNLDRPLTEGDTPYNYDSTFTQNSPKSGLPTASNGRRLSRPRRSDVAVFPMTDIDQTYDQLFQREVVQIPPRMELASQAEQLNKLIQRADAASIYSFSRSLQLTDDASQPVVRQVRRHTSLAKLLSNEPLPPADAVVDEAVEPQVEVDTQNQTHKLAKFRCLMNRDVTFVHALPHGSNHLLNSLVTEASNSFSNGRYSECMLQLKKCCVLNTDAANRPTLFFNQAVVLAHVGDFARAMADLNEAIKLDPEVFRYYKLGSVLWRVQERYIEASKDSKRAVSIEHNQAGHKHAHQVTRKALKAIAIVNTTQHVKTSKGVFEDAYEAPPSSRSLAQVDILIDQSSRIPSLAKLQHDILHALWRNLLFVAWPAETIVHVCKSTVSMYIVLEGTVTVQTDLHGAKQIQQTLVPGSIFSEATISTNLWPHTTLEAMTACRVLTLEHTVYKHTMKKVMMEGAFARALFFTTTGIFAEWTDEQRNTLGVLSENLYYNAGDVVVTEGLSVPRNSQLRQPIQRAPALHLYFVQSGLCGAVRLLGAHQPTHIQVATLSTGDIFGEVR